MHDQKKRLPAVLLSPRGPYRVGDVVSASWSMTNFSDRDLAGGRLIVNVPASVDPIVARSSILDARGEAVAAAFSAAGFALGIVRRGESINAHFELRFVRENAPPQALSLSLELEDGSAYLSEAAELVVRSRALLAISAAPKTFEVDPAAKRFGVSFSLENLGEVRAERIDLSVPPPTGFVLAAVRLSNGGVATGGREPFRLPDIARGEALSVVLEFEARGAELGDHVEVDGLRIQYAGGTLLPDPITVTLERSAGFLSGALGSYATTVEPGAVIRLDLELANAGQADVRGVVAAIELPPELVYCPGTLMVSGGADARRNDPACIAVGTVLGGTNVVVSLYATVAAPLANDRALHVGASLDGTEVAPLTLTVRSEASFVQSPSSFELEGPPIVDAGESRTLFIRAANAGTADALGTQVRIVSPHLTVERAAIVRSSGARETVTLKPTVSRDGAACSLADLGTVSARDIATLEIELRAPDHFIDGDTFTLGGDLRYTGGPDITFETLAIAGRCRPAIDPKESTFSSLRSEPLAMGQVRTYTLRVKNSGLAPARNIAVSLNLPGMLAIEAINGEPSRSDVVAIREIPAGAAVDVPVALRLAESVDGGAVLAVAPIVGGESLSSVRLEPVSIATAGRSVLDEFATNVEPHGDELAATLTFRNVGDAVAQHVVVAAPELSSAYLAETTRVGESAVPDLAGASLLTRGITLPPLAPGREIRVSYRLNARDADGAHIAFAVRARDGFAFAPEPIVYRSPVVETPPIEEAPAAPEAIEFVPVFEPAVSEAVTAAPVADAAEVVAAHVIEPHVVAARVVELEVAKLEAVELVAAAPQSDESDDVAPAHVRQEVAESHAGSPPAAPQNVAFVFVPPAALEPRIVALETTVSELAATQAAASEAAAQTLEPKPEPVDHESADETDVAIAVEPIVAHDFAHDYRNGNGNGHGSAIDNGAHTVDAPTGDVAPASVAIAVAAALEASFASATVAPVPNAYGLVGYTVFDTAEREYILRIAEAALARPTLGTYRHAFAVRALVPRHVLGASAAVKQQWEAVFERARVDLGAPFVAAAAPDFTASAEWANRFSDGASADVASLAIAAILRAKSENVPYADTPTPMDHVRGPIGNDFESYLPATSEPSGSVLNLIFAEAIPTESPRDPHLSKTLKRYRERLKLLFAALLYQNPAARHERMLSGLDAELDGTLQAIVDRLRDPRWA